MSDKDELITPREAGELLNCCAATVRRRWRRGLVPGLQLGERLYLHRGAIEALVLRAGTLRKGDGFNAEVASDG